MSDIKVGDLVMVVKSSLCCGSTDGIGETFVVRWLGRPNGQCEACGNCRPTYGADSVTNGDDGYDLRRLKRIPPLSDLERVTDKEELTA